MALYNWTQDVQNALISAETGNKLALKGIKKMYKKKVDIYVDIIDKENLEDMHRERLTALIIMDVHNYEIICQLLDQNINQVNAFEWQKQLRFYKDMESTEDTCAIEIR
jgi:dynein heavy chain